MKQLAFLVVATVVLAVSANSAEAQFFYRRAVVAPAPAPVIVRQPVVVRQPTVFYQPTTVVYSRRRPILGGYSVRTRPGYNRTVVW